VHLSGRGVLTGTILVPRRYFHTPLEVANLIDVENAILLTTAVVKRINSSFIKSARVRIK
jgi:putative aminopeptidase FrvX